MRCDDSVSSSNSRGMTSGWCSEGVLPCVARMDAATLKVNIGAEEAEPIKKRSERRSEPGCLKIMLAKLVAQRLSQRQQASERGRASQTA